MKFLTIFTVLSLLSRASPPPPTEAVVGIYTDLLPTRDERQRHIGRWNNTLTPEEVRALEAEYPDFELLTEFLEMIVGAAKMRAFYRQRSQDPNDEHLFQHDGDLEKIPLLFNRYRHCIADTWSSLTPAGGLSSMRSGRGRLRHFTSFRIYLLKSGALVRTNGPMTLPAKYAPFIQDSLKMIGSDKSIA